MKTIGDALELLTAQHDDIQNLLADLTELEGEPLAHALGELADKVATHIVAEAELRKTLQLADSGDDRAAPARAHHDLRARSRRHRDPRADRRVHRDVPQPRSDQEQGVFIALAETINPDVLEQVGVRLSKWSERASVLAA